MKNFNGIGVVFITAILSFSLLSIFDDIEETKNEIHFNWDGGRDRQSLVNDKRLECTATHKPTNSELTIEKVTFERGDIMERWFVKQHGGRWYYSEAFENFKCNDIRGEL